MKLIDQLATYYIIYRDIDYLCVSIPLSDFTSFYCYLLITLFCYVKYVYIHNIYINALQLINKLIVALIFTLWFQKCVTITLFHTYFLFFFLPGGENAHAYQVSDLANCHSNYQCRAMRLDYVGLTWDNITAPCTYQLKTPPPFLRRAINTSPYKLLQLNSFNTFAATLYYYLHSIAYIFQSFRLSTYSTADAELVPRN